MKKILSVLIASALILTASGCGNESGKETTTQKPESTQVIDMAGSVEDTTDETFEYLKEKAPLYANFLKIRKSIPLSFEIEVKTENGTATAGVYIKDETNISTISADGTGASSTTIYSDDKIYYIDDAAKIVYEGSVPVDSTKTMVETNLLNVDIMTAMSFKYTTGEEKEIDGVAYKCETISGGENNTSTDYLFDKETDEIRYIVVNGNANKITVLNNEVNEKAFEIPADYTKATMEEYFAANQ